MQKSLIHQISFHPSTDVDIVQAAGICRLQFAVCLAFNVFYLFYFRMLETMFQSLHLLIFQLTKIFRNILICAHFVVNC